MKRRIVDANVILRYLLNDSKKMSQKAEEILEEGSIFLPFEVVCEIVYVLEGVYDVGRDEIFETFTRLFDTIDITAHYPGVLFEGLNTYRKTSLDFVDCLLCGYKRVENLTVETFDKKLIKQLHSKADDKV